MINIVEDGVLKLPLFHGTGSALRSSIEEFGLGGRNPVAELNVIETLGALISLLDENCSDQEWWKNHRPNHLAIASQKVSTGGMNFRHGATYLTPSRASAVRYAQSNPRGSEAVTYTLDLFHELKMRVPELVSAFDRGANPVLKMANQVSNAMVVSVSDVSVDHLLTESGEAPDEQIAFMQKCLDDFGLDLATEGIFQQMNFELVSPMAADRLSFEFLVKL